MSEVSSASLDPRDFHTLFAHATIGIVKVSPEGRYLAVNPRFCELIGYAEHELLGRSYDEIAHPDDRALASEWAREIRDSGRSILRAARRYVHKQRHLIHGEVEIMPIRDPGGQLLHYITVFRDVTDRHRSTELQRRQKILLESLVRGSPLSDVLQGAADLVVDQGPGCGSTVFLAEAGQLHLGAAAGHPPAFIESIRSHPIAPTLGGSAAAAFHRRRIISSDVATDEHWASCRERVLSFGIRSSWATPVLDAAGEVLGTVCVCWKDKRDPEPRHFEVVDAAAQLIGLAIERERIQRLVVDQQAKIVASSKLAALGEMAAGVAHEINNPLTIINGRASQLAAMAAKGAVNLSQISVITTSIQTTAMRIAKIVRGLQAFARQGEQEAMQDAELAVVIEDTLAFCRERFRNHDVDLRVYGVPTGLRIPCWPVQLSQVLLNLLNNAFDAVENARDKHIVIAIDDRPDEVWISVTDTGRGIPPEIRGRIMEPFFTTKGVQRGTGLGLSISSGIVARHAGRIWLDSGSARTRFVVALPKRRAAR